MFIKRSCQYLTFNLINISSHFKKCKCFNQLLLRSKCQSFRNTFRRLKVTIDWSIKLTVNMISNGELSDPLYDSQKRGLTLVRLVEIDWVVWEKNFFLNFVSVFHYFLIISPWKKNVALHLNKMESPSSKNDMCQVWSKLA